MRRRFIGRGRGALGALLAVLVLGGALMAPAAAGLDRRALIRLATSVLKVEVIRAQGGYSLGSGVVVDADRVATNCHVTRDARQIAVLQGGLRLPAQSQQIDAYHDLCLLHVHGVEGARAVQFGEGGRLAIGEPVLAIGHTAGALQSSVGEVLALHRLDGGRVIQSSNYFNSGASGGGLFDADSRLVGILTFRLRGGTAHYFAMPAEWLERLLRGADAARSIRPRADTGLAFWEQPPQRQPYFLRAVALAHDANWSALQPLATEWARRTADDPEPWYLLGLALERQDLAGAARHAFECSLAAAPDFTSARVELERTHPGENRAPETAAASLPCHL